VRCELHCPPAAGIPVAAVAVAVAAVWAFGEVMPVAAAIAVTVLLVDAAGVVVLCLLVRYGRRMRPARVRAYSQPAARVMRPALTAPPRAIGGPVISPVRGVSATDPVPLAARRAAVRGRGARA
jgi:hypothetical protein